jgi:hypothetical protein
VKAAMWKAMVVIGGVLLFCGKASQESSFRATLSHSELISYGMINAYSTNILIQKGFSGGCLNKVDAVENVERNQAFVKVLQKHALSLKRVSVKEDEAMRRMIRDVCEVTTYLERQTESLKEWINEPDSASAKILYEGYCDRVEKAVDSMLKQ